MTHAQKEQLRAYFEAHSDLTQHKLAAWAKVTFKLAVAPSRKMIYRVLNAPLTMTVRNPECKTKHTVSSLELEERLLLWIPKAAKIRCDLVRSGDSKDTVNLQTLVFSDGWMFKFQKRHGLTSKRFHGEVASVYLNEVEMWKGSTKRDYTGL
uniref:AlNc14C24G2458 protein n=1 Tax=Albugo laibachii Nc14 TaxID=890382 RepID=F0W6F9_9STRA|nr:AlNc14C24G2458 [Albugo laibachii Nc14]|eukprot:CCA16703.1 AlNc14C24G2458 [Albugo laibachii Nc14]